MDEIKEQIKEMTRSIQDLSTNVTEIRIALKGYDGTPGLCADHNQLKNEFLRFRRQAMTVFGILVGSGVLGASIWSIFA